jgi:hypothetical protein
MQKGKLKTDLNYGETPWDDMTKEELLFEVWRMYSALVSSHTALALVSGPEPSPFWGRGGTQAGGGVGGAALDEIEMALGGLFEDDVYREQIYRAFFRYANDLLFDPNHGFRWMACDSCDNFIGPGGRDAPLPTKCGTAKCKGAPLRPLCWDDLRKAATNE